MNFSLMIMWKIIISPTYVQLYSIIIPIRITQKTVIAPQFQMNKLLMCPLATNRCTTRFYPCTYSKCCGTFKLRKYVLYMFHRTHIQIWYDYIHCVLRYEVYLVEIYLFQFFQNIFNEFSRT